MPVVMADRTQGPGLFDMLGEVFGSAGQFYLNNRDTGPKVDAGAAGDQIDPSTMDLGGGNLTAPTVGGPYGAGEGIPGLDTLLAQRGVQTSYGDYANVGTPPVDPFAALSGTPAGLLPMNGFGNTQSNLYY